MFGLDEISILDSQGNIGIQWYGDNHGASLESENTLTISPKIDVPSALSISQVESAGGANGTQKWVRFSATGKYSRATIYYDQEIAHLNIANYMDFLPIGANTLILPKAKDKDSVLEDNTHTSQFIGQTGEINTFEVEGRKIVKMDASEVYGKSLTNGNLDYFYRYLIPINDGNFVVVDAFKAKPGKQDYIQEFWYSYKDVPTKQCSEKSQDVMQSIDNQGALLLTPQCNTLQNNNSVESFGRITASSLEPSSFVLGAPDFMRNNVYFSRFIEGNGFYLTNRLGQKEMRRLARFVPDNIVSEDVRVFLLQSSTSEVFDQASVAVVNCQQALCFKVEVAGSERLILGFDKTNSEYTLSSTAAVLTKKNSGGIKVKSAGIMSLWFFVLTFILLYFRSVDL